MLDNWFAILAHGVFDMCSYFHGSFNYVSQDRDWTMNMLLALTPVHKYVGYINAIRTTYVLMVFKNIAVHPSPLPLNP